MKNKFYFFIVISTIIIGVLLSYSMLYLLDLSNTSLHAQTVAVHEVGSSIIAGGSIHSQNEATLHFATGGKLAYLPLTQGDTVYQGQTVAQLNTYQLQQTLTQALNNYRSTRDTFDQTQENAQTGVLQGGQKSALNPTSQSVIGAGDAENNAINDAVKRIIDQNQANLDNSVINVQIANYALQLATLTAPFNGILLSQDVTVAGQNITPATGFTIIDPEALVFRANIYPSDIDYVQLGAQVTIRLTGYQNPLIGTVVKIYPQKITLPTGEDAYQVDIQSSSLQQVAKYGQSGSAVITSSANEQTVTVPTWTILGHNQIWVVENGKAVLKTVVTGKTHGNTTEVLSGLSPNDTVILTGKAIAAQHYIAL